MKQVCKNVKIDVKNVKDKIINDCNIELKKFSVEKKIATNWEYRRIYNFEKSIFW